MAYREQSADAFDRAIADGRVGQDVCWADYVNGPKVRKQELAAHEAIFYEGDTAKHLYLLTSGTVMLYKLLPDGRRQVVEILKPGDLFGFHGRDDSDCTAETLTAVEVRVLNRRDIEASLSLQRHVGNFLMSRMESLHEHAMLLGRKSAMERVASYLMRLVPGRGMVGCPGPSSELDEGEIEIAMTRQEIADYLGLTIETVSRAMSELKRRGLIRSEKHDRVMISRICGMCQLTGMH